MAELSKAIARLMEQRERERARPEGGRAPEAREIVTSARAQVPAGERSLAENFVRHFLEALAGEVEHAELRLLAMAAFRFVMVREGEEPRIRVFDPSVAADGWESPGTAVQVLMRDRPFVVETVRQCLAEHGSPPNRLLHVVFGVERDQRQAVLAVGPPAAIGPKEILIHAEVERFRGIEALAELLRARLRQVMVAADDYPSMRVRLEALVEELGAKALPRPWNQDADEARAFLEWLGRGNFVFLGYREYQLTGQGPQRTAAVRPNSGLGLLRDGSRSSFAAPRRLADPMRQRVNEPPLVMLTKTNAQSPIHRRAHMDYVGIKEVDSAGVVVAERRFIGLFSRRAYGAEAASLPLLRGKFAVACELAGAAEGSGEWLDIRAVFNSIPKVELFALSAAAVASEIAEIRAARGSSQPRVSSRTDAIGRGVFVLVVMPRESFSHDVTVRIEQRLVRLLQASAILDREVVTSGSEPVRLHLYLAAPPENLRLLGSEDLVTEVADLMRSWDERLGAALGERFPGGRGRELASRFMAALPQAYKDATDIDQAVEDLRCLDTLASGSAAHVELVAAGGNADQRVELRLYQRGDALALGDFVDGLVNLGLRVLAVRSQEIPLSDLGTVSIHSFPVESAGGEAIDVEAVAPVLCPAILRLRAGLLENDSLNALIVAAGLQWSQVEVLRAYVNYCAEAGLVPSRESAIRALTASAEAAGILWRYFAARFDPASGSTASERENSVLPPLEREFGAVAQSAGNTFERDLLRNFLAAMRATLRTNYFVPSRGEGGGQGGRAALSLKIDRGLLPWRGERRPAFDIYVEAPIVRGFLLCDGRTVRAVIAPYDDGDGLLGALIRTLADETLAGFISSAETAVGGWVPLQRGAHGGAPARQEGALRAYLSALLDLTDNVEHGRIVPAADVIAYDELCPFLTIAPRSRGFDVGRIANELAQERRFWLGDAFAPGQVLSLEDAKISAAARGAWECARWHLFEAGDESHARPLTVVGTGDVSDAAFGSGVVLSRRFRLCAAVGEQHIFLDPDPDLSRSFAERERLFGLPRSTWGDYDRKLLSEGGGVFPRTASSIPLTDAVRRMLGFGVTQEVATPAEIVSAILAMEADLLWLGGAGTVVGASSEGGAAKGEGMVSALDLKAKVIVEPRAGAVSRRGRIEYAQRGGRINTDAIDGAAGVDLADHEVIFKLALSAAVEGGHMAASERVRLLEEVKPVATASVLARSVAHARAITLDQRRSRTEIEDFRFLTAQLAAEGLESRGDAPSEWELSVGRRGPWGGLSRPELAGLLALGKRWLQRRILACDVPDEPFFERYLRAYFPPLLNQRCGQQIRSHKLRREIIAAELARSIVESMGVTFVSRICRETGAEAAAVVRAWAVAAEIAGALALWDEIGNASPPLPLRGQLALWEALVRSIEAATLWVLRTQPPEATAGGVFDMFAEPARDLLKALPRLLPAGPLARIEERIAALAREGLPRALPERVVPLEALADILDIVEIASEYSLGHETVTELYYEIGELLDLDWVRDRISELPADSRWERRARDGLSEGLVHVRKELTRRVLLSREGDAPTRAALEGYLVEHREQLTRLGELIDDITSAQRPSLAALVVIVREYGRLVDRMA